MQTQQRKKRYLQFWRKWFDLVHFGVFFGRSHYRILVFMVWCARIRTWAKHHDFGISSLIWSGFDVVINLEYAYIAIKRWRYFYWIAHTQVRPYFFSFFLFYSVCFYNCSNSIWCSKEQHHSCCSRAINDLKKKKKNHFGSLFRLDMCWLNG